MENYTLPVAQATARIAYVHPLLFGDIYAASERHVCYTLHSGCSYAEAVCSPATALLEMLLVHLDIIATTYRSTIFKLMHSVCILIYVSLYLYSYLSTHDVSGLAARSDCPPLPLYLCTPAIAHY